MSTKWLFAASAIALALVFALVAFVDKPAPPAGAPASPPGRPLATQDMTLLVRPDSPSLGPAKAAVTLVEFLDPACETCATFYPEVKRMLAGNAERLRVVIRHVPFHDGSEPVVRMLEAARLQDRYWPALEALLSAQSRWVAQHRAQPERAQQVLASVSGLDIARVRSDMDRDDIRRRVAQDLADAKALRVVQTPEYFINGRPLATFGLDELKAAVNGALQSAR